MSEKKEWPWKDKFGDFPLVPVPPSMRKSSTSIFYVYMGVLACIAVLWGGGTLGTQFTLKGSLIVAIVGSAILAVVGALTAVIGAISRGSTYMNLGFPFGWVGKKLFSTIVAGIADGIGWYAVQVWLFGIIMHTILPNLWWCNVGVAAIWGGLLMMITAIIGINGIAWLSYLAVPFFLAISGVGIMIGIAKSGDFGTLLSLKPATPTSFGIGVTEVVGMYISGALIVPDIARFAKKASGAAIAWVLQIMIFQIYYLLGAAALTLATGATNIVGALMVGGIGLGAIMMAILGQWTTNDNNLYSGSLAFNTWVPIKRSYIVVAEGLIGTALAAWFGFKGGAGMQTFENFLTLLGKILPPIGGVLVSDFYLYRWYKKEPLKQRYQFEPGMKFAQVNWVSWVAAIVGAILGGWVIKSGIPALNGFLIGAALHIVIAIICDKSHIRVEVGEHTINEMGE
jgi:cytosine permease